MEQKRMAIINFSCDYPFEYCAAELGRWAGCCTSTTIALCITLDLPVIKGNSRKGNRNIKHITGYREYFKSVYVL